MDSARHSRTLCLRLARVAVTMAMLLGFVACQSDEDKLAEFMKRGDEYKEAEQLDEAIIEYRNVLQINPNHAAAHEALAAAYLQNKMFKEGYWELSETVRLSPDNIDARLSYGGISLAARRYDDAAEQAEAVIARDPNKAEAYLLLAQSAVGLERNDEVLPNLLKLVELEPDNGKYRHVLAAYYETQKEYDKAEAELRIGIERDPSMQLFSKLGRLLATGGDRDDEVIAAFEQAIVEAAKGEAETEEAGKEVPNGQRLSDAYRTLAGFYLNRKRDDEAIATMRKGIDEAPSGTRELTYMLTTYLRAKGQHEEADALLEKAAESDPTDVEPYLLLSSTKAARGDMKGALAATEKALAIKPDDDQARLRKAELLVDIGFKSSDDARLAEGEAIVKQVLATRPESPEALFVRSKIELARKDAEAAIASLRKALDAQPNWAQAHFVLGSALAARREAQRARAELARAIDIDPSLIQARRLLTKIHVELGEFEYAIEQGRSYLKSKPDDDEIRVMVAQSLVRLDKGKEAMAELLKIPAERRGVEALFAIGRLQMATGDLEKAREHLLQALALSPHHPKLVGSLFSIDRATGRSEEGVRRIDEAILAAPEDSSLKVLRGLAALDARDVEAAERFFKEAIEVNPQNLEAYSRLGGLYRATGRLDETMKIYEKAIEIQPELAPPHHFLAVLYEMAGRTEDAKKQYELAIKYDSSMGESKNNLAYLLAEEGKDLDRALKLAQDAKAIMPDSPQAADTLGWVLLKRGVASAAVGYLREAIQASDPADPSVGVIRGHLSLAYEKAGELDKAIDALEVALSDLERQMAKLREQGKNPREPAWANELRADLERLKSQKTG